MSPREDSHQQPGSFSSIAAEFSIFLLFDWKPEVCISWTLGCLLLRISDQCTRLCGRWWTILILWEAELNVMSFPPGCSLRAWWSSLQYGDIEQTSKMMFSLSKNKNSYFCFSLLMSLLWGPKVWVCSTLELQRGCCQLRRQRRKEKKTRRK